jgi:hypothetical protein
MNLKKINVCKLPVLLKILTGNQGQSTSGGVKFFTREVVLF